MRKINYVNMCQDCKSSTLKNEREVRPSMAKNQKTEEYFQTKESRSST